LGGEKHVEHALALNGIVSSALTALNTNAAALRVVSNNVANLNTDGYARRQVNQQALVVGGQLAGVDISDITRVVDKYLQQETLSSTSGTARYDAQNGVWSQVNSLLGSPGDGSALMSKLNSVFSALGQSALSPSSSTNQLGVLNALQSFASSVSSLSSSISSLQSQVDRQVSSTVDQANALIKQIYGYNTQIRQATASGDTASGLLDNRDTAVNQLAKLMDVRTTERPDGQLVVMTSDGMNLVSDTYGQLSYTPSTSPGVYGPIMLQDTNPSTGAAIGTPQAFDQHLSGGKLQGLLDMRDHGLGDLQMELGSFAQQTALAFNAQANANAAFPPPTTLDGRNTGLLSTDGLNFSGKTTVAVADANGNLVSRIDINFGAGTMSVDGSPTVSIGGTVGSFVTNLNALLGANGTADFTDGKLTISANGSNGVVVQDDATTPSDRGGVGFSQFFGLNDVFQAGVPSIRSTGLSASDTSGLVPGGTMSFSLKGPNGETSKNASVTIAPGMTIGDVVTALNTAFGGTATFALGSDGSLNMTPSATYANYQLNVTGDTTSRGTTGVGFTELFGLGVQQIGAQASGFSVNPDLMASTARLADGQPSITPTTAVGDSIVTPGDGRGALALQDLATARQSFAKVGGLSAQTATLSDFATSFYQDVATRSAAADTEHTAQNDRLLEAQSRQGQVSGVNLDEELSNMMTYQQAYSAGARMLTVVQQLYDTLLQIQ
jgi:flagellar hook-associated protein 1 FlgK